MIYYVCVCTQYIWKYTFQSINIYKGYLETLIFNFISFSIVYIEQPELLLIFKNSIIYSNIKLK